MDQAMEQTIAKVAIGAWELSLGRLNGVLGRLSDEALMGEVVPGRNRVVYLLGHLTAVHDAMIPTLGFGEPLYPGLRETFIVKADREVESLPPVSDLRACWTAVNERLAGEFAALTPEGWMARHQSVTDAEFALNPARNRMSLVLNRASHMAFHLGQIIFVLPPGSTRAVAQKA